MGKGSGTCSVLWHERCALDVCAPPGQLVDRTDRGLAGNETTTMFHDPSTTLLVLGVCLAAGLALTAVAWLYGRRRIRRLFLRPDPEALARSMRLFGVPDADGWSAFSNAWVYTLYGRFDSAYQALGSFDWSGVPPLLQAASKSVEALLCYLDTHDFERGHALARAALRAAEASPPRPGLKTAISAHRSLVDIGHSLTGAPDPDTIARLESDAASLPFGASLVATWGLAVAHARAGDLARANVALDHCRKMAPHCKPLCSLPT